MLEETTLESFVEKTFRWFHAHPELSYEEQRTTAKLKELLREAGIKILDLPLATGLVAEIGAKDGPLVALRADIDALPIDEETGLSYASEVKGKMHACGHDFHTTALLGAALLLKEREDEFNGRVRLVFQPAEEAPGGARMIIATKALEEAKVIFALHASPLFPVGTIALSPGPVMAAVDRFNLRFTGKGCHAAHPDEGLDVIPLVAQFVSALQTIVSRNSNPLAANLVSVTRIKAGNTWNVLPEVAEVEGTARTLTPRDREMVRQRFYALTEGMGAAFGAKVGIDWYAGPPPTVNDETWTKFAVKVIAEEKFNLEKALPSLGGEDFAYYQEKIPGVFIKVGTGLSAPQHSSKFIADPMALYPAAKLLAALAKRALGRPI